MKRPNDWRLIAAARVDVPVMADALLRVLDLHRRAHAVFSWNSGVRYEDPCPNCDGKAGVHDCGCWADRDIEYVCAECHRLGSRSSGVYDYAWPCATIRALEGATEAPDPAPEVPGFEGTLDALDGLTIRKGDD